MTVTIAIKSLNEERHIARTLSSALAAAASLSAEVVLADSGSSDRTIEIARQFPVRIYQLADARERSCGAGAQLAFQHARGDYFYLLDADMVLDPTFIPAAIRFLEAHPDVAAVGGRVEEMNVANQEFQIRARTVRADLRPGIVDRLDGGGLYRTAAVREAGYFADRNLHAFEEFELAARLQARGWKLARIDHPAVDHYGHTMGGYRLLWRRLQSGYARAAGEVVRGAMRQPHWSLVLRRLGHVRHGAAVVGWWIVLACAMRLRVHPFVPILLVAAPLLWLWYRRGSPRLGLFSFVSWNVSAWGLFAGLFGRRVPPHVALRSVELSGGLDR